ncbi:MAG: hypothetical protein BGO51_01105 [Rhodospirillales bacterium 69-11]|nr:MAG: hypothetical protein BGO51_01105 [Rhodospirillales bacterium 69-11]
MHCGGRVEPVRAPGPLGAHGLAAGFRQGRRIVPQIASVLAALARMGHLATTDGGQTFRLRRAA